MNQIRKQYFLVLIISMKFYVGKVINAANMELFINKKFRYASFKVYVSFGPPHCLGLAH